MIALLVRAAILFAHARAVWPSAPADRVLVASYVAVSAETRAVPAEILLAIAQHESDFQPAAVTWQVRGRTTNHLLTETNLVVPRRLVFGYIQAMGTREDAIREIARDGGMSAGVAELEEWAATCGGDLGCAMRGHAGGTRCALRDECSSAARAFARLFLGNARRLGMPARRIGT